jgi:hypothetical protein
MFRDAAIAGHIASRAGCETRRSSSRSRPELASASCTVRAGEVRALVGVAGATARSSHHGFSISRSVSVSSPIISFIDWMRPATTRAIFSSTVSSA